MIEYKLYSLTLYHIFDLWYIMSQCYANDNVNVELKSSDV